MLNLQRRIYAMALAASAFLVAGVASAAADTTPDPNQLPPRAGRSRATSVPTSE